MSFLMGNGVPQEGDVLLCCVLQQSNQVGQHERGTVFDVPFSAT